MENVVSKGEKEKWTSPTLTHEANVTYFQVKDNDLSVRTSGPSRTKVQQRSSAMEVKPGARTVTRKPPTTEKVKLPSAPVTVKTAVQSSSAANKANSLVAPQNDSVKSKNKASK